MIYIFVGSLFLIFYTFVGYPLSLEILLKIKRKKLLNKDEKFNPKISFIIAAYNEEKSIIKKLENILNLDYEQEKLEVIIASDGSRDATNKLVKEFIKNNNLKNFKLYEVKKRQGKTNAQNEAVKIATGEILLFSDANSIWDKEGIKKLIQNFSEENISYVCGRLIYINSLESITSNTENKYWNYDLRMREIESSYSSITAGNGAIYGIRKKDYIEIDPIECHDGSYPTLMVLNKKRAIYEKEAIAYEKAGEVSQDEFSRKVRMGRGLLRFKYGNLSKYNFFKVGIYSYFYFCHRYLRYSLYLFHIGLFISNIYLYNAGMFYKTFLYGQILVYLLAISTHIFNLKNKFVYLLYYYILTVVAQLIAVKKTILGQNKPFWEKAESTR
ncbi:glycosyltransferase family 2 protein [Cetobacterium ceti]